MTNVQTCISSDASRFILLFTCLYVVSVYVIIIPLIILIVLREAVDIMSIVKMKERQLQLQEDVIFAVQTLHSV